MADKTLDELREDLFAAAAKDGRRSAWEVAVRMLRGYIAREGQLWLVLSQGLPLGDDRRRALEVFHAVSSFMKVLPRTGDELRRSVEEIEN